MQKILQELSELFKGLFDLSPIKEVDHYISLKEGIKPIHVWPYCYVYY